MEPLVAAVPHHTTEQKLVYLCIGDALEEHRELARQQQMRWDQYVDQLYNEVCLYERMGHLEARIE
jgi:hypothetical protein